MLLLLRLAWSISWSSTGSAKTFHHRPCACGGVLAALADALTDVPGLASSLKDVGAAGRLDGSIDALVAHPASTSAASSGSNARRRLEEILFMMNSRKIVPGRLIAAGDRVEHLTKFVTPCGHPFLALSLLRSVRVAIKPSMPLPLISCANWLR